VVGTKIGKVDGLSKRVDWKVGVDRDNENQIFIKDNWIHSMNKDKDVVRVVEEMKKAEVKELRGNK